MAALQERPFSQTQLFCSNLPWSVNGKLLRQHFEVHGEVTDAFVAYNGRSSRGFGYVTFKEAKGAAAAVATMNGMPLGDEDRSREIRVEMARERPGPRPEPKERTERPVSRENGGRGEGRGGEGRGGEGHGAGRGRGGRGSEGRGVGEGRGGGEGCGGGKDGAEGDRRRRGKGKGEGEAGGRGKDVSGEMAKMSVSEPAKPAAAAPTVEESSES